MDEIESSEDIDAVIICTPTDTHADLIERFARAGKSVFCEKPVDLDQSRVRDCLTVVESTGVKLMVGFNRRFDPNFAAVKECIEDGRIGQIEMVTITSRDPAPPPIEYVKRSGGIFRDMTIHDFDMARFLVGEEFVSVSATASVLVDHEIGKLGDYDSATVVLVTASGKQVIISNSRRASYGYDQRIEVHGSDGAVSAENDRPFSIDVARREGFTRPPLHATFMTRYRTSYVEEMAHFISAIETGTDISPSGSDGLAALVLADAAARSIAEKRTVTVS